MLNLKLVLRFVAPAAEGSQYDAAPAGETSKLTLRMTGIIGFVALVAYVAVAGMLIAQQREALLSNVQELELVHARDDALIKVSALLARVVLQVNEAYYETQTTPRFDNITVDVEAVQAGLHALAPEYPVLSRSMERLSLNVGVLRAIPVRASLLDLRDGLYALVGELDILTRDLRERRKTLSNGYRIAYDAITVIAITMGLAGVILFGGLTALFFSRLAWDINMLEARARLVVKGYRGEPLRVTRKDEVGGLMRAVNQMQSDLRSRERQLEVGRQQRFHQERMATVGSLAAAIAHEINNPISAITGVAQEMCSIQQQRQCHVHGAACVPDLILEQAQRIARITRQISDLTASQSAQPQLMDVNGLVRRISNFLCYDERLRTIAVQLDLDSQLPALHGVPDEITQIVMNLLINAADAVAGVSGRRAHIAVSTRIDGDHIVIAVTDNGCGMNEAARAQAFDEGFTTKSKGSGIGLFMCKSLAEGRGGTVDITSTANAGTEVRVRLPLTTESKIETG